MLVSLTLKCSYYLLEEAELEARRAWQREVISRRDQLRSAMVNAAKLAERPAESDL